MSNSQNTPGGGSVDTSSCNHFRYAPDDQRIARLGFGVPALDLAALGCHVLPLRRGGKPPHEMLGEAGGVHWATNDPRQVRYWWETEDPLANVGVRTGRLPFGGRQVVVADLDRKRGINGPAIFRQFLAEHGLSLPHGLPADSTPSDGEHLWMGWPASYGPCPERPALLGGVDIKGDNGYVVAPPSFLKVYCDSHDGERGGEIPLGYRWRQGCPCWLPDAPAWFAEWITTAPATGRPAGSSPGSSGGGGIDVEAVMAHGAPAGQRNNAYFRLACSRYRKHGTSPAAAAVVADEVRAAWEAGDTAGIPWREVVDSIASARRFIEKQEQAEHRVYLAWLAAMGGRR